ncbi:unnamed protein product [Caretta caretta]
MAIQLIPDNTMGHRGEFSFLFEELGTPRGGTESWKAMQFQQYLAEATEGDRCFHPAEAVCCPEDLSELSELPDAPDAEEQLGLQLAVYTGEIKDSPEIQPTPHLLARGWPCPPAHLAASTFPVYFADRYLAHPRALY